MSAIEFGNASVPPTKVRYLVLAWFCAAAIIAYVHRNSTGIAAERIQVDLSLTDKQVGYLHSAFFLGYAIFQLPSGWLGHIWGTRLGLFIFAVLWSMATAWIGLANGIFLLIVARVFSGIAQAGLFPCCASSISKWFPEHQRSLPNGFLGSSMSVGAVISSALTGWLLDPSGWGANWQHLFLIYSIPGLVWAGGFYLWFRDNPEDHPSVNEQELQVIQLGRAPRATGALESRSTPWKAIFTSTSMMLICGQQFFRAAGNVFFVSWFPRYLRETHSLSIEQTGYLTSMPLLGVVLGGLIGGPFADYVQVRTGSRRWSRQFLGALSQYLCALAIFASYFISDPVMAVLVISAGTFAFAFGSCAAYTVTIDMAGDHVAPVFSTMNMAGNIGATVCPLIVGWLVDEAGFAMAWQHIPFVFVGIYFGAAICWTFLDPRGTIFDKPTSSGNLEPKP